MSKTLVPMIGMDNLGNQIMFYIDSGQASTQVVTNLLEAISGLQAACGGLGLYFRTVDEPNEKWEKGSPPDDGSWTIWVVKTSNPERPEEIVVPDGLSSGFMRLDEFHRRATTGNIQNITHYRPLTDEEVEFLSNRKK